MQLNRGQEAKSGEKQKVGFIKIKSECKNSRQSTGKVATKTARQSTNKRKNSNQKCKMQNPSPKTHTVGEQGTDRSRHMNGSMDTDRG